MLYTLADTVLVLTEYEFLDAHATWIGCTYGNPAINVTTAKYTHCDVLWSNVYSAMSSGSVQICAMIVAATRLSTTSLMIAVRTRPMPPMTVEGIVRRELSVVVNPRLRRDRVR